LTSLRGIEGLRNLEWLEIDACRAITSIEEVRGLTKLKKLMVLNRGDIASLKPAAGLKELEWLLFYEATNILDGDLSVLEGLPRLNNVSFQNRKHYTHIRDLHTEAIRRK
jgi:hypothetical protein